MDASEANNNMGAAAATLNARFGTLTLPERLKLARERIPGRIVFTTSFGLEGQALAHAIFEESLAIEVATLDTGRLFPETYDLWAETERRYGRRIPGFYPDRDRVEKLVAGHGILGFRQSLDARKACCHVRKVEPLGRALAGASAWIVGLRADQSSGRAAGLFAVEDSSYRLLKVSPLLDWPRARVVEYVETNAVPYNPLHDRGYLSIGCAPCTRAIKPGEPERAGRWWWEQDQGKECGLHVAPKPTHAPVSEIRAGVSA